MRRDYHQHFDFHWDDNWIHGEKYHPWPSMIWVIIDNPLVFFPTHVWSCLGYTLDSLLIPQLFLGYFLWFSTTTPTCSTMLMLPRSMTEVFRISTRTLEAHCRMFLDLLSKHRCMGNIMILPSPPLSKCFWTCCHIMYILLRFPLGRIYSQFLCVNTFSFHWSDYYNNHIFLFIVLFHLSCNLTCLSRDKSLLK